MFDNKLDKTPGTSSGPQRWPLEVTEEWRYQPWNLQITVFGAHTWQACPFRESKF